MQRLHTQEVAEEIPVWRRYPRKSVFTNLKSDKCPICGANKRVHISSVERWEDDTLWISWEETCENPDCTYDKIFVAKFFPDYPGLEKRYLG